MLQTIGIFRDRFRVTQRHDPLLGSISHDRLAGGPNDELVCGNDTVIGVPRDDRLYGNIGADVLFRDATAVTTYLDEEPTVEPTTWALWSGLLGIGLMLLLALLLSLWDTAFLVRRKM